MLYKLVFNNQIRLFDCKQTLTLEILQNFVSKSYPKIKKYYFYYADEEGDHIVLETMEDVSVFLEYQHKKPKIFVKEEVEEQEVFDLHTEVIADMSEFKRTERQSEKVIKEQDQIEELVVEKTQKKQEQEVIEQPKVDKEEQKQIIISHDVVCDECMVHPIKGIRYKCSVCEDFDLCGKCIVGHNHDEDHPFIKIRDSNSAPVSVQIGLQEREEEKVEEKEGKKEEQKEEEKKEDGDELKYESKKEKVLIISSYLESVLGSDDFNNYKDFAKTTNEHNQEKILEAYISWLTKKNDIKLRGGQTLFDWLKERAALVGNSIHKFLNQK